eukprot:COSAG02_NODE_1_length_108762_cov_456.708287_62_plen_126_part_00
MPAFDYASDAAFSINFWLRKGDCTGNAWEMLFSDASTSDTIPYDTQFAYAAEHHASWFDLYIGCDPQRDSTKADGTVPGETVTSLQTIDLHLAASTCSISTAKLPLAGSHSVWSYCQEAVSCEHG